MDDMAAITPFLGVFSPKMMVLRFFPLPIDFGDVPKPAFKDYVF